MPETSKEAALPAILLHKALFFDTIIRVTVNHLTYRVEMNCVQLLLRITVAD